MVGESPAVGVEHYENFPVASWLCPAPMRDAVQAIYAFARCADDLADEGDVPADQRREALAAYRLALDAALAEGSPPAHARLPAPSWASIFERVRQAAQRHRLPEAPLHDLLSAFEQDTHNPIYDTREALLDYCRRSANPVGRLMLHLAGVKDAIALRESDAICTALQLINFWQDLGVDVRRGRHYVTQVDLNRHGLQRADLSRGDTEATVRLVREMVTWSRSVMTQGLGLPLRVPGRLGWELRFVVQGGLRILERIEALGCRTLTHRPVVRAWDLPLLAWRAWRMPAQVRTLRMAGYLS